MKKTYATPEMEVIEFETEDVITTSQTQNGSGGGGYSFPIMPLD